jgi:hypothetical protein
MLTDIFSSRYAGAPIWKDFGAAERRLIVQCFRLLEEHVCPYWINGKEYPEGKRFWKELHDRLSMELGSKSLSSLTYSYVQKFNGVDHAMAGHWTFNKVCENWMLQSPGNNEVDIFIKERLSLIELGFRMRAEVVAAANAKLEGNIALAYRMPSQSRGVRLPGDPGEGLRALNKELNAQFSGEVEELNTRFRQAGCGLHYHNGFIQQESDTLTSREIGQPFWALVSDASLANVDLDMKEAINRRDTGGRDPAFYAARSLESTIKILSDNKGLTHGGEKGAHNYIDNLASKNAGFIELWEAEQFKAYFSKVRNPLGHGPGNEPMPTLTKQQTDWAIDFAMASIKSLIRRSTS